MTDREDVVDVYEVAAVESGGRQWRDVDDVVEQRAVARLDLPSADSENVASVRLGGAAHSVEVDVLKPTGLSLLRIGPRDVLVWSLCSNETHLLHGDVRRRDVLAAHVLDLGVQVDVFSGHVAGAVQSERARQRSRRAAAATQVLVLPQLHRLLNVQKGHAGGSERETASTHKFT